MLTLRLNSIKHAYKDWHNKCSLFLKEVELLGVGLFFSPAVWSLALVLSSQFKHFDQSAPGEVSAWLYIAEREVPPSPPRFTKCTVWTSKHLLQSSFSDKATNFQTVNPSLWTLWMYSNICNKPHITKLQLFPKQKTVPFRPLDFCTDHRFPKMLTNSREQLLKGKYSI